MAETTTKTEVDAEVEAEAESEEKPAKTRKRNEWTKRSDAKLLKGRAGHVSGNLRDLDKIKLADDEDMSGGSDIFAMNESFKDGEKGERLNSYKMEEKQAMSSPLRSSEMKSLE